MDFETLERLWRSEANARTVAETYLLEKTMKTLKNRRLEFQFGMGLLGLALLGWTGVVAYTHLVAGQIDIAREWGLYLMLAISWITFFLIQGGYGKHLRAYPNAAATMPDALEALLDENRVSRRRTGLVALASVLFSGATGFVLWQLFVTGKMAVSHVLQASVAFGAIILICLLYQGLRYVFVLRPEAGRLKTLLRQYED